MATTAGSKKRKRSVLTLEMKLEIVKVLEKGTSQRVVGDKFGVAKSTVADIWKYRKKIADSIAFSESPAFANKKRCIIRHPKFHVVDEACSKWFCGSGFASSAPRVLLFLLLVKKWRDEAARMRYQSMKQASILSYFQTK